MAWVASEGGGDVVVTGEGLCHNCHQSVTQLIDRAYLLILLRVGVRCNSGLAPL